MIDDPEKARRLARALCSDVLLYNGDSARAGTRGTFDAVMQAPLAEARALYASRVSPALVDRFDGVAADMLDRLRAQLPDGPAAVVAHPPVSSVAPPHPSTPEGWGEPPLRAERAGGSAGVVVVIAALVLAVAVLGAALLLRH